MLSILTLIAGLVVLVFAGDYLVRGAVALAEKLSIDPLIIGLTIVAFGTSAPELFVSLQAAFDNVSGIAIGNIIGSNIANILLVLGAPAMLMTINCRENGLASSLAVMIVMTLTLMVMMWFGPLSLARWRYLAGDDCDLSWLADQGSARVRHGSSPRLP